MSTQIRFTKKVVPPGVDNTGQQWASVQIIVLASHDGLQVVTGEETRALVPWEDVDDMEALATVCATLQVWQFRAAVELLGKASRSRELLPEDDE